MGQALLLRIFDKKSEYNVHSLQFCKVQSVNWMRTVAYVAVNVKHHVILPSFDCMDVANIRFENLTSSKSSNPFSMFAII